MYTHIYISVYINSCQATVFTFLKEVFFSIKITYLILTLKMFFLERSHSLCKIRLIEAYMI